MPGAAAEMKLGSTLILVKVSLGIHMLFCQRFVWTTACYAIKFILSYDGANPAILRLQMRLMCWDVDIVHRNDHYNADADY